MPTGSPVSGSRAVSSPVLMLKIASGVITYFRLAAGRGRRNTEMVGCAALEAVDRIEVDAGRIADDLDGELGRDRAPGDRPRRPRQPDADQAAIEQQRMRALLVLRQARVVGAVDGGEHRIAAAGHAPALAQRRHREAHRIRRLMTGHARASVGAERREERMPVRVDRAGGQQHAEPTLGIGERHLGGEPPALAGFDPSRRAHSARGLSRDRRADTHAPADRQGRNRDATTPAPSPAHRPTMPFFCTVHSGSLQSPQSGPVEHRAGLLVALQPPQQPVRADLGELAAVDVRVRGRVSRLLHHAVEQRHLVDPRHIVVRVLVGDVAHAAIEVRGVGVDRREASLSWPTRGLPCRVC